MDESLTVAAGLLAQNLLPGDSEANVNNVTVATSTLLPGAVANALVRAYEDFLEFDLTSSARRVFACLIRYGLQLKNPKAKVFIRKATIASLLNVNEATVYRSLSCIENAGLIRRDEQEGLNTISRISFTDKALKLLGITKGDLSEQLGPDQSDIHSSTAAQRPKDGLASVQDKNSEPKQSFSKRQPAAGIEKISDLQKVPADLRWLVTQKRLSVYAIFQLMSAATKQGHRLSNIVLHARKALEATSVEKPYAYIRSLIDKRLDYAFLAKAVVAEQAEATQKMRIKAKNREDHAALRTLQGRTYQGSDGNQWFVDDGCFVRIDAQGKRASVPHGHAPFVVSAILSGQWTTCAQRREATSTRSDRSEIDPAQRKRAREILGGLRSALIRQRFA